MKKFNDLNEFLSSDEFRRKDLSYLDLSNLDLSELEPSIWNMFIFDHTNFSNTNIKFCPRNLREVGFSTSIEYCDFSGCDLSYLSQDSDGLDYTSIKGCNFTNTNLHVPLTTLFHTSRIEKDYTDVVFGEQYTASDLESINDVLRLDTLFLNPNIEFSSIQVLKLLQNSLNDLYNEFGIDSSLFLKSHEVIQKALEYDRSHEGYLSDFFKKFENYYPLFEEEFDFFLGSVSCKDFKDINLSDINPEILACFDFFKCSFNSLKLPYIHTGRFTLKEYLDFSDCTISKLEIPNVTPDFWKENHSERLFDHVTFRTNLYLELGRFCNGKCKFCRNQYLPPCKFDIKKIEESLHLIYPYLSNIVVGGGEPTLILDKLMKVAKPYKRRGVPWTIFTNASLPYFKLRRLSHQFSLNISRHSIDDDANNDILGVEALSNSKLARLNKTAYGTVTLCATCFDGGISSAKQIEDYISFYTENLHINHLMFQTLHKDLRDSSIPISVLPIDNEVFDEVLSDLKKEDYKLSLPIYSTGDYKLVLAKKNNRVISFKQYLEKDELEHGWKEAVKRTFDLSMDPSGNLYQNWHQSSGKVLLKELQKNNLNNSKRGG